MAAEIRILNKQQLAQYSLIGPSSQILDYVLYDTLTMTSASTQNDLTFFQQANGQSGVTEETTNMVLPSQLNANWQFILQKVVLRPLPAATKGTSNYQTDMQAVVEAGFGKLKLGGRDYYQAPVDTFVGGGLQGFGDGSASNNIYSSPRALSVPVFEYPYLIPATTNFALAFHWNTAPTLNSNVALKALFIGKLIRPVQG